MEVVVYGFLLVTFITGWCSAGWLFAYYILVDRVVSGIIDKVVVDAELHSDNGRWDYDLEKVTGWKRGILEQHFNRFYTGLTKRDEIVTGSCSVRARGDDIWVSFNIKEAYCSKISTVEGR